MTTQQARCVHDRPKAAGRRLKKGSKPENAELDGVPDCVEPSEACRMRRNDASSNLRSRPSGKSRVAAWSQTSHERHRPGEEFQFKPSLKAA